ncbi:MAG: HDOD domain-containing protein [Gammaproteobacteria bacterium]|nr:HDOD domain-containing protein [Gammaproteobacteria bacterium]
MIERIAECIARLRPISPLATQCLAVLSTPDVNIADIVTVLERDPGLASHLLKLANSPFYGCASRISTVHQACMVLGTRTLKQSITAAAVLSALDGGGQDAGMQRWRHAAATACAARALAHRAALDPDVTATAGLLHDIGRILIGRCCTEQYRVVADRARREAIPLLVAERDALGTDHAAVGATISARWHMPPELVAAIASHHDPDGADPQPIVDVVHVANVLAHALDANDEEEVVPELSEAAWRRLGLDMDEVRRHFPDIASAGA